jgi:hypothetical protein
MFRSSEIVVPPYDALSRQAVLAADAPRVAGFLGKRLAPQLALEIGSRLCTRIEGRAIKHDMGAAGVKVYDEFARVLRVETTVGDVSFFKHHRRLEHKGAAATRELALLMKSIHSLIDLCELLPGCSLRYLEFRSSLDDPGAGERDLQRLRQPRVGASPPVKGVDFVDATDHTLLRTLQRGESSTFTAGAARRPEPAPVHLSPAAMSRQLRRLRLPGPIGKLSRAYRHCLTRLRRAAIAAACSLTRFAIVPAMAAAR